MGMTQALHPINGAKDIKGDPLTKVYSQVARRSGMTNAEYHTHMRSLNNEQCHIVIYNRAWCKCAHQLTQIWLKSK